MASLISALTKRNIVDTWAGETLKLMLLSSLHLPNAITQNYISDVSDKEILDDGGVYTAGGVLLTEKESQSHGNNYFLDAEDVVIGPGASLNYLYGVLYKDTGNPATSPIRAHIYFETNQIVTNGTSTIRWNTLGIIYVS